MPRNSSTDTRNLLHDIEGHAFGARIGTAASKRAIEAAKTHNQRDVAYRRAAVSRLREALAVTGDAAKNRAIVECLRAFTASYEADCLEAHAYSIDGLQHVEAAHGAVGEITQTIEEATRSARWAQRMEIERGRARVGGYSGGGNEAA